MTPCYVIDDIVTPKKFVLRGLWFGPKKPKRLIIWVHGLGSSVFSMHHVITSLADTDTAVLTFNNRGHDIVSKLYPVGKKEKTILTGAAHEVFTDCIDDIQGAITYARKQGVKAMYLAGHSTGCQKACYWASKTKGGQGVRGIILVAPVCDYAVSLRDDRSGKLAKAVAYARKLVRTGRKHELMPPSLLTSWSFDDAQRFLSLYTPDSSETIFSYEQPKKIPRTLRSIIRPILVVWAQNDEYADRPAKDIVAWFNAHISGKHTIVVVPRVGHGFRGAEKIVRKAIRSFISTS